MVTRADRGSRSWRHRYADHGPAGLPEILRGLGLRLRWRQLAERHDARLPVGTLALINGATSIGLMALAAKLSHQPLVFPSLGPTAFLLFYRPHAEASCPRNALVGHLIGALSGLAALAAFGLLGQGPALTHLSAARIGAAAMSLGLTAGCMVWVGTPHPPAGATTLIISLGFLHTPTAVGVLMAGVALLVAQGIVINRWAGIDYPVWTPHHLARPTPAAARPRAGDLSPESHDANRYIIFVDAVGDSPATDTAFERLRAALGDDVRELACRPREWTGMFTVEAAECDEASDWVRQRVDAADNLAGLSAWHFHCFEVRETLVRLDDDVPHWHLPSPHWPHPHPHWHTRRTNRR